MSSPSLPSCLGKDFHHHFHELSPASVSHQPRHRYLILDARTTILMQEIARLIASRTDCITANLQIECNRETCSRNCIFFVNLGCFSPSTNSKTEAFMLQTCQGSHSFAECSSVLSSPPPPPFAGSLHQSFPSPSTPASISTQS